MGSAGNLVSSRFKKAVVLVAAIALISGASVYAHLSSLPSRVGPRVSVVSFPLELSMELEATEYDFGENITVVLCVRNIGNETVRITKYAMTPGDVDDGGLFTEADRVSLPLGSHLISGLLHIGVSIVDQNGTKVHECGLAGMLQALYDVIIEPGGYLKQKLILFACDTDLGSIPLPYRGTYQMRAVLYRVGIGIGTEFTPRVTIETPPITITSR